MFTERLVARVMPIAACISRRGPGMVIARKGRLVFVRVRDERKCAGLFGPISAFLLGLIQCLIRRLDQVNGRGVPAGNRTGKAHADGGAATVRMRNAERLNSLPKRFRHLRGSIRTGTGKDYHKLIAAVPSNQISWPVDGSRDSGGHLPETFVSRRMAEGIVVGRKTIDVEHDQRKRRQFTDSTTPFLVQEVVKLATVGNAGEAIKTGQAQQHLICFLELTHDLKELLFPSPSPVDFVDQSQH
jgi:hypothetical protein